MQKIGICLFVCAFLIIGGTLIFSHQMTDYAQVSFIGGMATLGLACFFTMFGAVGWQTSSSK